MPIPSEVTFYPGAQVSDPLGEYLVVDLLDASYLLVQDAEGKVLKKPVASLQVVQPEVTYNRSKDLALLQNDPRWQQALHYAEIIRPLVELGPYNRTVEDIKKAADAIGKNISTIYRMIKSYESTGDVTSLLRKPRFDKGKTRLSQEVEDVIEGCIRGFYLTDQRRSISKTVTEIRKICIEKGLPPPEYSAIRSRIFKLDNYEKTMRREGYKAANERYRLIKGSFPGADYPLAVVQIDHTPVDLIIVDEEHRKPIGRPYFTIAIDVYSRMIVGFYISLDPPSELATGICISNAIRVKETYLKSFDPMRYEWPCHGVMKNIHTDNGMDFRGSMLRSAAQKYGIILQRRPKGRPNYGGTVERAFRTFMSEVHNELEGTTFSNTKAKLDYDSEKRAVMTLDALERWFAVFILGVYHQRPHDGIDGQTPLQRWIKGVTEPDEHGFIRGVPARFQDEDRLRLDFLPFVTRTIQESGVSFNGVLYWSDSLRRFIHQRNPNSVKAKKEFICRFDPRDISKIWVLDEEKNIYIEAPYRNMARQPISLWELKRAKKIIQSKDLPTNNEELIFRAIDDMRAISSKEMAKTSGARRLEQRRRQDERARNKPVIKEVKAASPVTSHQEDDDDFTDFNPSSFIRES